MPAPKYGLNDERGRNLTRAVTWSGTRSTSPTGIRKHVEQERLKVRDRVPIELRLEFDVAHVLFCVTYRGLDEERLGDGVLRVERCAGRRVEIEPPKTAESLRGSM